MAATGIKLSLTLPTGAKATLNNSSLDTGNTQTLSFGNKDSLTATIVVTAENGRQKTYNLTVIRDYDDTSITITPKGGSALKASGTKEDTFAYVYLLTLQKAIN